MSKIVDILITKNNLGLKYLRLKRNRNQKMNFFWQRLNSCNLKKVNAQIMFKKINSWLNVRKPFDVNRKQPIFKSKQFVDRSVKVFVCNID